MKLVFINPILPRSNGRFWKLAFVKHVDSMLHIKNENWSVDSILKFKPDHIHFNSAAQPVERWIPVSKINMIRRSLPNIVITTYYCDALKSIRYRKLLNTIVDCAYCSYDLPNCTWMPVPADINFWKPMLGPDKKTILLVFLGNNYTDLANSQGIEFTRARTLKLVSKYYDIKIVGSKWSQYGLKYDRPTNTYEQAKSYYDRSFAGINIVNNGIKHLSRCWSNRLTHMMLMGLTCFTPNVKGIRNVFGSKDDILVVYDNDNDLVEKLHFYMSDKKLLVDIGSRARKFAVKNFDINVAVKKILTRKKN